MTVENKINWGAVAVSCVVLAFVAGALWQRDRDDAVMLSHSAAVKRRAAELESYYQRVQDVHRAICRDFFAGNGTRELLKIRAERGHDDPRICS